MSSIDANVAASLVRHEQRRHVSAADLPESHAKTTLREGEIRLPSTGQ
jgi:hypothetical protein